jgi:hypothetical protein
MTEGELLVRFLAAVGPATEAEFYLRRFRSDARRPFAVVVLDASTAGAALERCAYDLRVLARLGLYPVVLHEPARGRREEVVAHLTCDEVPYRAIEDGWDAQDEPWEAFFAACRDERVAVAAAGAAVLPSLVRALGPVKIVFLDPSAPLRDDSGEPVSTVNFAVDSEGLSRSGALTPAQRTWVAGLAELFAAAGHRFTVSLTTPESLLRELFTARGAGTLVKRGGAVLSWRDLRDIDVERLHGLLEEAFGRRLDRAFFDQPVERVYIEEHYEAGAVLTRQEGMVYLDKFAVTTGARGEGTARDLLRALRSDYPVIFWRSRPGNPINGWYLRHCDGMLRAGSWFVFQIGMTAKEHAHAAVVAGRVRVYFRDV